MYRTGFNQNFLVNPDLVADLVDRSSVNHTDTVYDIGAGKGIISQALIHKARQVIAIESDPKYFALLQDKFANTKNIQILQQDFLELKLIDSPFKVFSNIPFNITTEIFRKLCFESEFFIEGYFVVDENALNKTMLFVCLHNLFDTEILFNFLRSDFNPAPSIKTLLFHTKRKPTPDIAAVSLFNDFIAACFSTNQPDVTTCLKKIFTPTQALRLCKDNKIKSFTKHSQISQSTWYRLFDFYQKNQAIIPTKVAGSFSLQYNTQAKLKKIHDTYTL